MKNNTLKNVLKVVVGLFVLLVIGYFMFTTTKV